ERYDRVRAALETLPATVNPARLFQVDMQLAVETAVLDKRVVPELVHAAMLLAECVPAYEDGALRRFCGEVGRRGERRAAPLLEALDGDGGIGFARLRANGSEPEPLLSGVNFPAVQPAGHATPPRTWGGFEEMLLRKLEALAPGQRAIELTLEDFAGLP